MVEVEVGFVWLVAKQTVSRFYFARLAYKALAVFLLDTFVVV